MAWTKSGIYLVPMMDIMVATSITNGGVLYTATTNKIALHSNSLTDGSAPINFSATTATWANTNEVSGTGWVTGGIALSAAASGSTSVVPTLAEGTTGSIRYNWTNPLSVATTTLTNVRGCILYMDAITAPTALIDAMYLAITFGADYSTVAGTFGITPSATGLFEIDVTP